MARRCTMIRSDLLVVSCLGPTYVRFAPSGERKAHRVRTDQHSSFGGDVPHEKRQLGEYTHFTPALFFSYAEHGRNHAGLFSALDKQGSQSGLHVCMRPAAFHRPDVA